MRPAFPTSDYYEDSARPRGATADDEPARRRPGGGGEGSPGPFPRSPLTVRRVRRPAFPRQHRHEYAAGLPHGLPAGPVDRLRSRPSQPPGRALRSGPYPPGWSRFWTCGGSTTGSCTRTPSRLACRTRAVWQYRPVPSLSGLLPPSPASPGSGCPSFSRPLRRPAEGSFHPLTVNGASWRTTGFHTRPWPPSPRSRPARAQPVGQPIEVDR